MNAKPHGRLTVEIETPEDDDFLIQLRQTTHATTRTNLMEPTPEIRSAPIRIGKIPFTVATPDFATAAVISAAKNSTPLSFRFANAYCVAEASSNHLYAKLLNSSGINYPDGTPVYWLMRHREGKNRAIGRVRGPSLFLDVLDKGRHDNIRHFLLGSTPRTLEILSKTILNRFPGTEISGTFAPPFGPLDDDFYRECFEAIQGTQSQIIWVALGAPKQDFAATEITRVTGLPTAAVGAAFDFTAGTAKEAPEWMQTNGLEWAFRFATEPRRLWKRYLFGNIRFVRSAVSESKIEIQST